MNLIDIVGLHINILPELPCKFDVVCAKPLNIVSDLGGEQVVIGQPDYFLPAQVEQAFVFPVHHHVAPVQVAHVDHRVGVVDQCLQLLRAAARPSRSRRSRMKSFAGQ